jgi:hypothetical protein
MTNCSPCSPYSERVNVPPPHAAKIKDKQTPTDANASRNLPHL